MSAKRTSAGVTLPSATDELKPEQVIAVIDTREQQPYNLAPLRSVVGTLGTGDYGIWGMPNEVAIERSSLPDFIHKCTARREPFERELGRLHAYRTCCVMLECTWADLCAGGWRSKITPQSVTGSVLAWQSSGIQFFFAGDRASAELATARMLFLAARRRWRELSGLLVPAELAEPTTAATAEATS